MRKDNLLFVPALLMILAIFIESSFRQPEFIDLSIHLRDKIFHFFGYFILGLCVQTALLNKKSSMTVSSLKWITLIFGSVYGASDEFHQYFVPGRSCDVLDWVADTLGTAFSLVFFKLINKLYTKIKETINK